MPPRSSARFQKGNQEDTVDGTNNGSAIPSRTGALQSDHDTQMADAPSQSAKLASSQTEQPLPPATTTSTPIHARKPVQRLHSLHTRSAFTTSPNTTTGPKALKRQPKAPVRRNQADREAQNKLAAERDAQRHTSSFVQRPSSSLAAAGGVGHDARVAGFGFTRGGLRGGMFHKPARFGGGGATGHLGGGIPRAGAKAVRGRGRGTAPGRTMADEERNREATRQGAGSPTKAKRSTKVKAEKDKETTASTPSMTQSRSRRIKKEKSDPTPATYSLTDEEGEETDTSGRKLNIDLINLLSDEESHDSDNPQELEPNQTDGVGSGVAKHSPDGAQHHTFASFRPVRLDRQEHVDCALPGVSARPSSNAYLSSAELRRRAKEKADAHGSLFMDDGDDEDEHEEKRRTGNARIMGKGKDVQVLREKKVWKGAWDDDDDKDDMKIKDEPMENTGLGVEVESDDKVMNEDKGPPILYRHEESDQLPHSVGEPHGGEEPSPPSSPNDGRIPRPMSLPQGDSSTDSEGPVADTGRRHRRSSPASRPIRLPKPKFQTPEEQLEWQRYEEDLRLMSDLLHSGNPALSASSVAPSVESEKIDAVAETLASEKKDTKLEDSHESEKQDKTVMTDAKAGKIYMLHLPPLLPSLDLPPTAPPPIDSPPPADTAPQPGTEDSAQAQHEESSKDPPPPPSGLTPLTKPSSFRAGKIGYLRLHASSRVTMTWGDMLLSLGRTASDSGAASSGGRSSLQEVMVMNYSDCGDEEDRNAEQRTRTKGDKKGKGREEDIFRVKVEDDDDSERHRVEEVQQHAGAAIDDEGDAVMTDVGAVRPGGDSFAVARENVEEEDKGERGAWAIGEINGGFVGVPEWEGMFG